MIPCFLYTVAKNSLLKNKNRNRFAKKVCYFEKKNANSTSIPVSCAYSSISSNCSTFRVSINPASIPEPQIYNIVITFPSETLQNQSSIPVYALVTTAFVSVLQYFLALTPEKTQKPKNDEKSKILHRQ